MKIDEQKLVDYISWLEYKKLMHIVRYYPTLNMYIYYRNYAHAYNLQCFGGECSVERAHALLLQHLRNRLQERV